MTGEITLRGRVLPIGGLREKSTAAYKNGMKTVLIPEMNKADLDKVNDTVKKAIEFIPVSTLDEVLSVALESPKATDKNQGSKIIKRKAINKNDVEKQSSVYCREV
jgi:ATP-dependent Lon protease